MADLTQRLTYVLKGDAASLRREIKTADAVTLKAGKSITKSFGAISVAGKEATESIEAIGDAAKTTQESESFVAGFASALDEAGTSFSELTEENVAFSKSMANSRRWMRTAGGIGITAKAVGFLQRKLVELQSTVAETEASSLDAEHGIGKFGDELEKVEEGASKGEAAVKSFGEEVETQIGERSPGLFHRLGQSAGRVFLGLRDKSKPFLDDMKAGLDGVEQAASETDGVLTRTFGRIGTRLGEQIRFGVSKRGRLRRAASDITKVFLAIFGAAANAITTGAQKLFSAIPLPDLDLTAKLRPNLQGLSETVPEIDEVVQKTNELSESLEQASEESDSLLVSLAAIGIAVAAAGTAMVAFGINSINALTEVAEKIDIPIDRFSTLRQGIQNLGARGGAIDKGLTSLSTALKDIDDDSTAAGAALKALGITATEPEAALLQLSDALRTTRESEARTRAVTVLLGVSTRELVPVLEGGAEAIAAATVKARDFGNEISGEGSDQAAKFTRNLKAIGSQFKAIGDSAKLQLTQAVLPSLVDVTDTVRTASDQTNILRGIWEGFKRTFEVTLGSGVAGEDPLGLEFAKENLQAAVENVKEFEEHIRAIEAGERIQFNVYGQDILAITKKNLQEAQDFAAEAAKTVQKIAAEEAARLATGVPGAAPAAGAAAGLRDVELETDAQRGLRVEREKTQASTLAGLQKELALLKAGTDEARARFELEEGRFATFDQATKDQIQGLQTAIDLEKDRVEALEESEKAAASLARTVDSQLESAERSHALGEKTTASARIRFELEEANLQTLDAAKRLEIETRLLKLELLEAKKLQNAEQEKANTLLNSEVAKLEQQIALAQARTEIEKTRIALAGDRFASLTEEQRMELETLQVRLQSIQTEKAAREELASFAATVIEEGLTLKERQIEAEARLNAAFQAGFLTQEQLQAAIERSAEKFKDLADEGEETFNKISEFGKEAAKELASGLKDVLLDPSEEGFKAMGEKWAETLQEMAAEALLADLFGNLLGGGGGGGGGGLGDLFGGLFGAADGGRISGPGTSTSDSVPILASDGEFMQPARAVAHYGEDFMESIRRLQFPRAPHVPRLRVPNRRAFATGGLVTVDADRGGNEPAAPPANDITLALLRSEDELDQFMSSARGEKATIRLLEKNKTQIQRIPG